MGGRLFRFLKFTAVLSSGSSVRDGDLLVDTQALEAESGADGSTPLQDTAVWTWDVARIRAKGYTDNVPDLLVGKLRQLPDTAQAAMQQIACLGNVIEISTMRLVSGNQKERSTRRSWRPPGVDGSQT